MQITQGFVHLTTGNNTPISCQVGDYIALISTFSDFQVDSSEAELITSMSNANWSSGSSAGSTAYIILWKTKTTSVTIKGIGYGGKYGAVAVFRQ